MSYTASDFAEDIEDLLAEKGYEIHDNYEGGDDEFWFTWSHPTAKTDIECGGTFDSESAAWIDAARHYFANTDIETTSALEPRSYLLSPQEHATVLAALRTYQQVLLATNGDIPDELLDVASNGGSFDRMEANEIDGLCERLNY